MLMPTYTEKVLFLLHFLENFFSKKENFAYMACFLVISLHPEGCAFKYQMESFGRFDRLGRRDRLARRDRLGRFARRDRHGKPQQKRPLKKVVARRLPGYRDWVKTYFRNPRKSRLKFRVHMDYTSY